MQRMRQSSTLNINISNVHSQNSENPDILYRMVEGFGTKQNKKTQKFTDRFRTTSVLKVYFFFDNEWKSQYWYPSKCLYSCWLDSSNELLSKRVLDSFQNTLKGEPYEISDYQISPLRASHKFLLLFLSSIP